MKKVLTSYPRSAYTVANVNKLGKVVKKEFHVKRLQLGVNELFFKENKNKGNTNEFIENYVNNYFVGEEEALVLFFVYFNKETNEFKIHHHTLPFAIEKVINKYIKKKKKKFSPPYYFLFKNKG